MTCTGDAPYVVTAEDGRAGQVVNAAAASANGRQATGGAEVRSESVVVVTRLGGTSLPVTGAGLAALLLVGAGRGGRWRGRAVSLRWPHATRRTTIAEVGSFTSRAHAEMAAGMLDAHGVRSDVLADDAGGALPHVAMGSHGFRVHVADEDRAEAEALLADLVADTADTDTSPADVGSLHRAGVLRVATGAILVLVVFGVLVSLLT